MGYHGRKSLKDIVVEKANSHQERDPDGNTRVITRMYKHKVQIRTANAGTRIVHQLTDRFLILGAALVSFIVMAGVPILGVIMLLSLLLLAPVYYVLTEHYFQQTLGKMITGSVVINEFAERPAIGSCIVRTIVRVVPFEPWSFLGTNNRGWHDEWSNTWVVSKQEAERLKMLVSEHNTEV